MAAAEETASSQRAKAVALIAAGYGIGSGLIAIMHSLGATTLGFRGVVLLALVPLAALPFIARWVVEPDRFTIAAAAKDHPLPVLGAVGPRFRRRLLIVAALTFAVSLVTGPANSFFFLYAQNVMRLSGAATALLVACAGAHRPRRAPARPLPRRPGRAADCRRRRHDRHGAVRHGDLQRLAGSPPASATSLAVLAASVFAPGCRRAHQRALPDLGSGLGRRVGDRRRRLRRHRRAAGLRRCRRRRQPFRPAAAVVVFAVTIPAAGSVRSPARDPRQGAGGSVDREIDDWRCLGRRPVWRARASVIIDPRRTCLQASCDWSQSRFAKQVHDKFRFASAGEDVPTEPQPCHDQHEPAGKMAARTTRSSAAVGQPCFSVRAATSHDARAPATASQSTVLTLGASRATPPPGPRRPSTGRPRPGQSGVRVLPPRSQEN